MSLNLFPTMIFLVPEHYVFIEAKGSIPTTAPKAWQDLRTDLDKLQGVKMTGFKSLYKLTPEMIYRAGVTVDKKPENLPDGFSYSHFEGGNYYKFTVTGSYSQLPEACGKVFEFVKQMNIQVRDGFYIENYLNDPKTTPEDKLVTEIMIPIA